MSDGDGRRILVIQGGQVVKTFPASPQVRAFPIAVVDTVRTTGYAIGETGGEYTLDGTPTGATYQLMQADPNGLSDGTTDGEFNYGMGWSTGNVWKYDREWKNGSILFSAGGRFGGVAYDPTDGTFWLSADRAAGIRHYDAAGNLLGSFNTQPNLDWNLALEPSSGTLWVSSYRTNNLHNYAKDGTYLGSVAVPGMTAASFFSGEFVFGSAGCVYKIKKSKSKGGCENCPEVGSEYATNAECETIKDCDKKIKTTIACPRGGNGTCKLKGKRSSCG
ncbi:MAG: hypothetical protein C4547_05775 [Phycisphaerales bacterium]|nr:MAG: hypothetical protein C4547_05775 [Phycisphaerales bacterium]